jgi:hypothetical protein
VANLPVNTSTDGTTLVAAPGSRQFVRVVSLSLTAGGAVDVTLKSNSTVIWYSKAMSGATAGAGIVLPKGQVIDCAPGQALVIGLSASVAVQGSLEYIVLGPPQ